MSDRSGPADTSDPAGGDDDRSGISRRAALRGAAIGTGVGWVAPAVLSTPGAYAQGSVPSTSTTIDPGDCTQCGGSSPCLAQTPCGTGCYCSQLAGGGCACTQVTDCAAASPCPDGTCPPGYVCVVTCCGPVGDPTPICVPLCTG